MLRSKYAAPQTPTEVILTFLYRGKKYKIRRNPEYDRPKKSGQGFTTQSAGAELTLPDGKVITKTNEVKDKIQEILGIDCNQFTQIAMIAQGDFLKLLLADTKNRQAICAAGMRKQKRHMRQPLPEQKPVSADISRCTEPFWMNSYAGNICPDDIL
jgi:DNA repair exonuclease SbcCD ATPase subunit